ncbi:MAG TPA: PIN domain-containing protein, partial [Casimicrobiaceae bacterium]|nr:PIN domain-containing protein [Casimicrobiaceae bacterium]
HRTSYEAWLESQLPHFDVLTVTDETAIAYAALRVALRRSGHPIPANDAWIAALALQHRLPVLSRDQHFDVVPDLERKSW